MANTVAKPDPADYIEAHILPRMDPEIVDYVTLMVKNMPPKPATIEDIRANPKAFRGRISVDTSEGFAGVKQYTLTSKDGGTFPVRVYHPQGDAAKEGTIGVLGDKPGVHINFHGGGFVLGDLYTEAQLCLSMREAGIVVVDVDYRHCPATLWGKCFEDAWAALQWVLTETSLGVNTDSLSVGGVSAGAYISTVLHQRARDEGIPLRLVMATVPSTAGSLFHEFYTDSPFPSFHEFVRTPILSWARIQSFAEMVLDSVPDVEVSAASNNESKENKKETRDKKVAYLKGKWPTEWVAPLYNPNFKDLAPVFVRTAELDLLRDEGEAYAMAVVKGGGTATLKRYPGTLHTFMFLDYGVQKHAYDVDSIVALRQAHGLAPLPLKDVKQRVDRVLAEVKAQQAREKEQNKVY